MDLTHLTEPTMDVEVEWRGQKATVSVYPGRLTRPVLDGMSNLRGRQGQYQAVKEFVASWDIIDDKGEQLGVTDEVLDVLPVQFFDRILAATYRALRAEGKD